MDGDIAPLPQLCDLAEKYNCIMMVDDCTRFGVLGRGGRGRWIISSATGACTFRWELSAKRSAQWADTSAAHAT